MFLLMQNSYLQHHKCLDISCDGGQSGPYSIFVISSLDYFNLILACLPLCTNQPLQLVQNALSWLLLNFCKFSHITLSLCFLYLHQISHLGFQLLDRSSSEHSNSWISLGGLHPPCIQVKEYLLQDSSLNCHPGDRVIFSWMPKQLTQWLSSSKDCTYIFTKYNKAQLIWCCITSFPARI